MSRVKKIEKKGAGVSRRAVLANSGILVAATAAMASEAPAAQRKKAGRSHVKYLNPPTLAPAKGYTPVVEVTGGRTIYVSGQIPVDKSGALVGVGNLRAQTQQVFENLKAGLAAAGATFADVIKLNIFMLDVSQVQVVRDVRDTFVDTAHPPASTLVEVRRLVREEFLIEIDAVASVAD